MKKSSGLRIGAFGFAIPVLVIISSACSPGPTAALPCVQGKKAVISITTTLSSGLEAETSTQIKSTFDELREITSEINLDLPYSLERDALAAVRDATDAVVDAGEGTVSGTSTDLDQSIDNLVMRIGELDQACGGQILSPQA